MGNMGSHGSRVRSRSVTLAPDSGGNGILLGWGLERSASFALDSSLPSGQEEPHVISVGDRIDRVDGCSKPGRNGPAHRNRHGLGGDDFSTGYWLGDRLRDFRYVCGALRGILA